MRALHSLPLIAALALLLGGCVSPVVIDHRAGTDVLGPGTANRNTPRQDGQ